MSRMRFTRRAALALSARLAALGALPAVLKGAPNPVAAQEITVSGASVSYYPETGHNLRGAFLQIFEAIGGVNVVGLPLSEERFVEATGVVQSFEGIAFIYDPSLDSPWDRQAMHLSDDIKQNFAPSDARQGVDSCSGDDCEYFTDTNHTVSGDYFELWQKGGFAVFGMALSEPYRVGTSGVTRQVFERVIMEYRPETGVRLLPVIREQAEETGEISSAAFMPAPPTGGETHLVASPEGLRLRTGPGTEHDIRVLLADNAEYIVAPGASGKWLPGYADGYSGWVSAEFLREPEPLPEISESDWDLTVWQGAALSEVNVRREPSTQSASLRMLQFGDPVVVTAWVKGEEVYEGSALWARIGPDQYVFGRNVGRNAPVRPTPIPSDAPRTGKWIDVNLTQQIMVAYEDRNPVRTCLVTTGMAGWETPPGNFRILVRVANETMESDSIGAESFYKLEDVLFTQYFTDEGHAIHFAWWRTPETIGRPGSHGCLNLLLEESQYFWDWAEIGTPVIVHY